MAKVRIWGLALVLVIALARAGAAQDWAPLGGADEEEYQSAFRAVLADPSDAGALARYANAATRVGNIEAAIATLERLVAIDPELGELRYELAVLYLRIRAPDFARVHLEKARGSAGTSSELATRSARLLARIDLEERAGVFTGSLSLGVRYQTNANAGTDSSTIREAGFDVPTPSGRRERDDANVFFLGSVAHVVDLGREARIPLETRAATYWARHFDVGEADLGALEATTGPRLALFPSTLDRVSMRPFALVGFSVLENDWNHTDFGGGVELEKRVGLHSSVALAYSGRRREFDVDDDRSGTMHRIGAIGVASITTDVAAAIGGYVQDESAEEDFHSNREGSAFVRGTVRYRAPLGLSVWPWQASLQVRWIGTFDEEPDDRVDSSKKRRDHEIEVVGRNTFWLTSQLALFAEASYVHVESNLSIGDTDNTTVAAGTTWSF